jgi:hypothetical protein
MKTKRSGHVRKPSTGVKKKQLVNANHEVAETNDANSNKQTCDGYCVTSWKPAVVNS